MIKEVTEDYDPAENYRPIAVRDDFSGNTVISFNPETRDFILAVSGKLLGPLTSKEMGALNSNITDVLEMKGRFLFTDGYTVTGERV